MNRMHGALLDEAIRLVADGYTGVKDIDIGFRKGLNLGWSIMEHFETIDHIASNAVRRLCEPLSMKIR